jgi:hypothetical protein
MRAIRLPNGDLLIPMEEPDESDAGDSIVEITPDDPHEANGFLLLWMARTPARDGNGARGTCKAWGLRLAGIGGIGIPAAGAGFLRCALTSSISVRAPRPLDKAPQARFNPVKLR